MPLSSLDNFFASYLSFYVYRLTQPVGNSCSRRKEILDAAIELISDEGYASLTMRALAGR